MVWSIVPSKHSCIPQGQDHRLWFTHKENCIYFNVRNYSCTNNGPQPYLFVFSCILLLLLLSHCTWILCLMISLIMTLNLHTYVLRAMFRVSALVQTIILSPWWCCKGDGSSILQSLLWGLSVLRFQSLSFSFHCFSSTHCGNQPAAINGMESDRCHLPGEGILPFEASVGLVREWKYISGRRPFYIHSKQRRNLQFSQLALGECISLWGRHNAHLSSWAWWTAASPKITYCYDQQTAAGTRYWHHVLYVYIPAPWLFVNFPLFLNVKVNILLMYDNSNIYKLSGRLKSAFLANWPLPGVLAFTGIKHGRQDHPIPKKMFLAIFTWHLLYPHVHLLHFQYLPCVHSILHFPWTSGFSFRVLCYLLRVILTGLLGTCSFSVDSEPKWLWVVITGASFPPVLL